MRSVKNKSVSVTYLRQNVDNNKINSYYSKPQIHQ